MAGLGGISSRISVTSIITKSRSWILSLSLSLSLSFLEFISRNILIFVLQLNFFCRGYLQSTDIRLQLLTWEPPLWSFISPCHF
jgi:hypothetical protein